MTYAKLSKLIDKVRLDANEEFNDMYGPADMPVPAEITTGADILKKWILIHFAETYK